LRQQPAFEGLLAPGHRDQRRQNFDLPEEFLHRMSSNGADVCGQVGSNR